MNKRRVENYEFDFYNAPCVIYVLQVESVVWWTKKQQRPISVIKRGESGRS